MGVLTDVGADAALDAMLGDGHAAGWPATLLVALSLTDPGSVLTEPSGGGYAQASMTNSSANWPDAAARTKTSGAVVAFPTATGDWGSVGWFALLDGTTVLGHGVLDDAQTIVSGDTPTFPAGALTVNL